MIFFCSGNTPFGAKILLIGNICYECGHLLLTSKNSKVLGGNVEKLVDKWKIGKVCILNYIYMIFILVLLFSAWRWQKNRKRCKLY